MSFIVGLHRSIEPLQSNIWSVISVQFSLNHFPQGHLSPSQHILTFLLDIRTQQADPSLKLRVVELRLIEGLRQFVEASLVPKPVRFRVLQLCLGTANVALKGVSSKQMMNYLLQTSTQQGRFKLGLRSGLKHSSWLEMCYGKSTLYVGDVWFASNLS